MTRKLGTYGYIIDPTFDEVEVEEESTFSIYLSMNDRMRVDMQILYRGEKLFLCGSYQYLINVLEKVDRSELPLTDVVILQDRGYYFEGTI